MQHTLLALLLSSVTASAADKPIVYNHIAEKLTPIDQISEAAYTNKFSVIDVWGSTNFVPPKVVAGSLPRLARTATGEPLGGYVLVAYLVNADGRAAEPVVLKSDDERLNRTATNAVAAWHFVPATFNGVPIASLSAQEFNFETTPTEFVTQVLEPTGGKIARPKDWFYSENSRGTKSGGRYMWTLSREDTTGGKPYTTGVRIQTFVGITAGTGKTAKQFILDFIASKQKDSIKVIKTCAAQKQGFFTRTCLETEEGPYHILYSLFWGDGDSDVAVITIAGTTPELWETYAPTFDRMSFFELIDMQRFEK